MRLPLTTLALSFAVLLSAGCPGVTAKDIGDLIDTGDAPVDADGDGFNVNDDCDDDNADVNPDAEELCDGIDNNCDEVIDTDATDLATFYADGDGDTYGNNDDSIGACADAVPTGYVADNTDCDDAAADVNPAADEVCNDIDDNCDGAIDEDTAIDASAWFADTDADTYGDPAAEVAACTQPSGYVADNTDCDDTLADVNTDGIEICDSIDNDCDDTVDEDDATDALTWYADGDADSYGDAAAATVACNAPSGYVADATDCDDAVNAVNPAATEYCDTIDNDCDDTIDEDDAADAGTFYVDGDGDGFGNASSAVTACYASSDDTGTSTPGTAIVDVSTITDTLTMTGCGTLSDLTVDMDITHTWRGDLEIDLVSPGGTTVRLWDGTGGSADDLIGNFNDAATDLTSAEALSAFVGEDGAGDWVLSVYDSAFGDSGTLNSWGLNLSCGQVTVADQTDCDDSTATTYPGADEYCNGVDDDCDNTIDEADAIDAVAWYEDSDQDGYGDPAQTPVTACYANGFYTADNATDCNDSVATTYPGADEYCNGVDDDCDAVTDEDDAVDASTWYTDADGDGYGDVNGTGVTQCAASTSTGPSTTVALTDGSTDYSASDYSRGNIIEMTSDLTLSEFSVYVGTGNCSSLDFFVLDQSNGSVVASSVGVAVTTNTSDYFSSGTLDAALTSGETYAMVFGWSGCTLTYHNSTESVPLTVSGVGTMTGTFYDDSYDGVLPVHEGSESKLYTYSYVFEGPETPDVADNTDCDDTSDAVNTAATELCNGSDDNCSGTADDATASFEDDATSTWSDISSTVTTGGSITESGTVYFCAGTHSVSFTTDAATVSIVGFNSSAADTVLDGGGTDRVIDVTSVGDISLSNLTVQNGYTGTGGANIRCDGAGRTLSLDNVVVDGGDAGDYGGGIYVDECTLTMNNSSVQNNTAGNSGGGIYIANEAFSLTDSDVTNNSAPLGGGIRMWGDDGNSYTSELVDSWVESNTATGGSTNKGGGAALGVQASSNIFLDLKNTTDASGGFLGNLADANGTIAGLGGAIYLDGAPSSSAQADVDSASTNGGIGGIDFGDSGTADDNSPDDIYVNDAATAYFLGDGSGETGREFDCDSGDNTDCDFEDLSSDAQQYNTSSSSSDNRLRGHAIQADDDYEIESFGLAMNLGSSCDLDFYILESTTGSTTLSDWTQIAYTETSPSSTSSYVYVDSGYVGDVTLVAGNYYAFLVGFDCSSSTYYKYGSSASGTALGSVDSTFSYFYDNSYTAGGGLSGASVTNGTYYDTEINYN